jgi:6-phosphogluconolactonase (cycloisomerase 2 family)
MKAALRRKQLRGAVVMLRTFESRLRLAVAVIPLLTVPVQIGAAADRAGNVYLMTNQASGNAVMIFHRDAAGMLTLAGSVATGGNGAGTGGDPLGSQGSLTLSEDQRLLVAVNAGSDSVSIFAVEGDQLNLLNTVASGGTRPVSVAVRHGRVYVLNAGGTPNISGFTIDGATNRLVPLAGSTRNLPGGTTAAPAQVSFTPDGDALIVTEKGTNSIDTFRLDDGRPAPGVSFPSSGLTPFGFAFGDDDVAIVSDAGGGSGGAAVSSYKVEDDGNVRVVSPALGDGQTAACWLVVPRGGRFAYTANAGSATISSYAVSGHGTLALLNATAASTGNGSAPTDMALSGNSRFLYTRNGGKGTISGFRLEADSSLTAVVTIAGVPAGSQGIAAR